MTPSRKFRLKRLPPAILQLESIGWFHVIFCVWVCLGDKSTVSVCCLITKKTESHLYKAELHKDLPFLQFQFP